MDSRSSCRPRPEVLGSENVIFLKTLQHAQSLVLKLVENREGEESTDTENNSVFYWYTSDGDDIGAYKFFPGTRHIW